MFPTLTNISSELMTREFQFPGQDIERQNFRHSSLTKYFLRKFCFEIRF